ncbi:Nucleotide-diphospho-sugar transferases superfamily protein [Klebsormidium nitens]|uniref:Nucleotide-diphospho-sugar transferases superfamily protein n=1 Tax=Klebsormidium nitens TaxID=105231 RepID=A0A1Y1IM80_KLENI|nr:Nucleotide-diphospho-sugar transferases superfamily protein [Klebsormidium nitens]|eukprot:GAQ89896.1 Nucleotide-diphospho-sugar transferases superfamily protein [Klebsormidium nitens]
MDSAASSSEGPHHQDPDWERLLFESRLGSVLVLPASSSPETDRAVDVSMRGAKGAKALIHPEFRIFIGYDAKEDVAFQVCKQSILKHASVPVHIVPIKQKDLRDGGLYTRLRDPTESTEFSFTRFLTPYLAGYMGWAMFVDCDFLYTADIKQLTELIDDKYAVMCVKHDYAPTSPTKMDGQIQTTYPRKNWSSMVLYNCGHPKNRILTPELVSQESGAFLHRFQWLDDEDIGNVPETWNWLVGHNKRPEDGKPPKAIHYTCGGPWFKEYAQCEYAELWVAAEKVSLQRELPE